MYNSGGYMAQGTINSSTGYSFSFSAPNQFGVGGGLPQVFIQNPSSVLTNVTTGIHSHEPEAALADNRR